MHRYYVKSFLVSAVALMLAVTLLGAAFIGLGKSYTVRERKNTLTNAAESITHLVETKLYSSDLDDLDLRITITTVARASGGQCFIADETGKVVSCSDESIACDHIGKTVDVTAFGETDDDSARCVLTSLDGFYSSRRYVACCQARSDSGLTEGYVFCTSDASAIDTVWGGIMVRFIITAMFMCLAGILLTFLSSREQAKPIREMAAAADKFAHGDFSVRVEDDGRDDEIGALASAFNQMAASLDQSEKQRTEFIANVAHEIKTPMTTISGFADGILDGTIPPDMQKGYLETISRETKRLNRLVRKMLDVSRTQSMSKEELLSRSFDAGELLVETMLTFDKKIEDKHLEVNAEIPEDPVIVRGEHDSINQVMYNLIENATKFAPDGTELGIRLWKQGSKAYVAVRNHGETIAPEELPLLFDRFHKTDKSRSMDRDGYGLGLYIVKSIVTAHGEDVAVTSRDGVTEFVFSLPLKEDKAEK